jgi:beta-glucanase (GH16 family)
MHTRRTIHGTSPQGHHATRSRQGRATVLSFASLILLSSLVLSTPASAVHGPRTARTGCDATALAPSEPSRKAPPPSNWLAGATRVYCSDFPGTELPGGWGKFSGVPGGDPAGYFDPSHVVVDQGMLSLLTARESRINNRWATGGVCHCGVAQTYGTYLVRSRLTGSGIDNVQMLWPVAHNWPPEVDFNETGDRTSRTAWYVHYSPSNHQIAKTLKIDLLRWHTWGVIWTPHIMKFTVDGAIWGTVRSMSAIPHEKMTLDLSQQTWCGIAPECPSKPASMQVDWVAEFSAR